VPRLKPVSGEKVVKILCRHFGFSVTGQRGSHVRLSRETPQGKVGTVVPLHRELKRGTPAGRAAAGESRRR
jgi:predicted RNA binding protein YcfA (HicA-like mRNA interferase family)|tara:strand:+ start:1860 stop:2072 length:213 start_codon:yes stop_codon:yes gene_type:complete